MLLMDKELFLNFYFHGFGHPFGFSDIAAFAKAGKSHSYCFSWPDKKLYEGLKLYEQFTPTHVIF